MENVTQKEEIRQLPLEYKHSGMTLKQLERTDKAAIYKSVEGVYEVFKIKIAKASVLKANGKETTVPARERVPGHSNFGDFAWSYGCEKLAFERYNSIK